MTKRLLFAFATLLTVVAGFAQAVGDYVYTPQGRFKITADKITGIVNPEFKDWVAVSAEDGTTCSDQFVYVAEGENGAVGFNSVKTDATEGMTYTLTGIDAGSNYVVTFTMTQPEATTPNMNTRAHDNCADMAGTSDAHDSPSPLNILSIQGVSMDDETDVVEYTVPTEIKPGDPKTYSFTITPSDVARSYTIRFLGFCSDVYISDIKVQEAVMVGDDRIIAADLDYAKQLLSLREWQASDELQALNENIELAEDALTNPDTESEEMLGILEGLQGAIKDFQANVLDDQIPNAADKIPYSSTKMQKGTNIGVWYGFGGGAGRIFASDNNGTETPYSFGNYGGGGTWGNGNGSIGAKCQISLQPGSYIFSMEQTAIAKETAKSKCYQGNTGLSYAYGVMYIRPVIDGETEGADGDVKYSDAEYEKSIALAYKQYDMNPADFDKQTISVNITEAGTYEFAVKTYAQPGYESLKNGSNMQLRNASIYGFTGAKYNKAQLDYETAVRVQITAARDNLTKAAEYVADTTMPWGKPELQEAIETYEPVTAAYEAMSQDEIIATFDKDTYDSSKGLEAQDDYENYYRLLESEIYRLAAKGIIAANNSFVSKNATLASLPTAITAAEEALSYRIYDMATAKPTLLAAIASAEETYKTLFAEEYSEENAALVTETITALNEAIEALKSSIPASAITTIVDIDFESSPVYESGAGDPATENVTTTIPGAKGSMYIDNFSTETVGSYPFEVGRSDNGEKVNQGVLRVGKGSGTVEIETPEDNYGTDVVRISMDFWYLGLSGGYVGFFMKDENQDNVAAMYFCPYDNAANTSAKVDLTGIADAGGYIVRSGGTYNNQCSDDNLNHIEYVLDYGNKIAYATATLQNGNKTVTTSQVDFSGNAFVNFILQSTYTNTDRRCWFDNLKIERIAADPATASITENVLPVLSNGKIYNLSGMEVKKAVKGIYIMNGKKFVIK